MHRFFLFFVVLQKESYPVRMARKGEKEDYLFKWRHFQAELIFTLRVLVFAVLSQLAGS
jgi:hypothetical protein